MASALHHLCTKCRAYPLRVRRSASTRPSLGLTRDATAATARWAPSTYATKKTHLVPVSTSRRQVLSLTASLVHPQEGVMTKGYSTNATDAAVQANIVAAGYGK